MGGPASGTVQAQQTIANSQSSTAAQANAQSQQLFDLTYPGEATAENYYQKLSTGDPQKIQAAIAPAEEQIAAQSQAAKQNIKNTTPQGGVQQLALQQADIQKASDIGGLATQAYSSSFPALAAMGSQGLGISVNEMANAISALGGAAKSQANVGQEQAAGKASTLGFIGALGGAGAEAAGSI